MTADQLPNGSESATGNRKKMGKGLSTFFNVVEQQPVSSLSDLSSALTADAGQAYHNGF